MPENDTSLKDKIAPAVSLVWRRRWTILCTAAGITLATAAALYKVPNSFTSDATLFVVEQQVPQRYVTPTSTTELADVLPAMTQQVLSRSRLLELVSQFDLYSPQRFHLLPEQIDTRMRKDIKIEPLPPALGHRESNAFKISFTAPKAKLAQDVTAKLTSLFIQENLRTREDQARNTTNFLREQLQDASKRLARQESLLRDYKTRYLGELPEQQQGNLAILNGAELQLQNISSSLDRARQQRVYLESLLDGYRRLLSRGNSPAPGSGSENSRRLSPYLEAQADLAKAQAARAKLLLVYLPQHPDVQAVDREIAATQAVVDSLKPKELDSSQHNQNKPAPASQAASGGATPSEEDSSIAQITSQLASNRVELENLSKEVDKQKAIISEYQSRLNLTPVREQELASILRDYELSKQDYSDLLGKEQQSQLAMSLEKEQAGQQFRVVEPPSLPALPSSPKRLKISLGAMGAGLILGLLAAFLAEMRNPVYYTEKALRERFSIPLIVCLPVIVSSGDLSRRKLTSVFQWFCGAALLIAVLTAEAWVYRHPN